MLKKVGVISDTHGLLRPEAVAAMRGVDHIIHAGDIGKSEVAIELSHIAPLTIVRGNVDTSDWGKCYPEVDVLEILGHSIYVLHNLDELDLEPAGLFSVVIFGHSHKPENTVKDGVLYFNPGSAGPRRFRLPIALGMLTISQNDINARILNLED